MACFRQCFQGVVEESATDARTAEAGLQSVPSGGRRKGAAPAASASPNAIAMDGTQRFVPHASDHDHARPFAEKSPGGLRAGISGVWARISGGGNGAANSSSGDGSCLADRPSSNTWQNTHPHSNPRGPHGPRATFPGVVAGGGAGVAVAPAAAGARATARTSDGMFYGGSDGEEGMPACRSLSHSTAGSWSSPQRRRSVTSSFVKRNRISPLAGVAVEGHPAAPAEGPGEGKAAGGAAAERGRERHTAATAAAAPAAGSEMEEEEQHHQRQQRQQQQQMDGAGGARSGSMFRPTRSFLRQRQSGDPLAVALVVVRSHFEKEPGVAVQPQPRVVTYVAGGGGGSGGGGGIRRSAHSITAAAVSVGARGGVGSRRWQSFSTADEVLQRQRDLYRRQLSRLTSGSGPGERGGGGRVSGGGGNNACSYPAGGRGGQSRRVAEELLSEAVGRKGSTGPVGRKAVAALSRKDSDSDVLRAEEDEMMAAAGGSDPPMPQRYVSFSRVESFSRRKQPLRAAVQSAIVYGDTLDDNRGVRAAGAGGGGQRRLRGTARMGDEDDVQVYGYGDDDDDDVEDEEPYDEDDDGGDGGCGRSRASCALRAWGSRRDEVRSPDVPELPRSQRRRGRYDDEEDDDDKGWPDVAPEPPAGVGEPAGLMSSAGQKWILTRGMKPQRSILKKDDPSAPGQPSSPPSLTSHDYSVPGAAAAAVASNPDRSEPSRPSTPERFTSGLWPGMDMGSPPGLDSRPRATAPGALEAGLVGGQVGVQGSVMDAAGAVPGAVISEKLPEACSEVQLQHAHCQGQGQEEGSNEFCGQQGEGAGVPEWGSGRAGTWSGAGLGLAAVAVASGGGRQRRASKTVSFVDIREFQL